MHLEDEDIRLEDGRVIQFHTDEDPFNPREDDNLAVIVGSPDGARNYGFFDRATEDDEAEALRRGGFPLLRRYLRRFSDVAYLAPLGMLDHSGVHIWVGGGSHWSDAQGWDSGTCGYAYITNKGAAELGPDYTPAQCIEDEVKTLDQYLRGDVYGFIIKDEDGEHLDSCWGHFGFEYVKEAALEAAEATEREHPYTKAGMVEVA